MKSHASMNRIYRIVWNAALNVWMAVAESARGSGKGASGRGRVAAPAPGGVFILRAGCRAALALLVGLFLPQAHAANAADATVSSGAGQVSTTGNTTTIHQTTQRLAIDWLHLSTAAGEALVFNQPNAAAIALNRITGSSPSELLGSLTANGQIFILNPNGVLFGAGSQVNVGGLVASTLSMSNADFEACNHVFTNAGTSGAVVNQGRLNAAPGGYLALLAPEVRNEGVMTASLGTALLAAGNKVTLTLDNGSLLGYSIDQGAIQALAENKHLIQANGGQVLLSAKALDSLTTATVNNTGVIEAKTLQNKSGRILLMGDMAHGTVNAGGTLDASASDGGDGGFIETSAAHVRVADGTKVTTLAPHGSTGTWLIDPTDFTISAGGAAQTTSGIGASTLSTALDTTDVAIATDAGGAQNGDIHVNSAVNWSANKLTLTAHRNININANLNGSGTAQLALEYGQSTAAGTGSGYVLNKGAKVNLPAGANFSTRQGSAGATLGYTVITALGAQGSTSMVDLQGIHGGLAGRYVLGADIDAAATAGWNAGAGFAPLGVAVASLQFTGHFDGLGHTINGLVINRPTTDNVGLFGSAGTGTLIRNVGLVGGSVTGRSNTGSLVGAVGSVGFISISNVYATGSVGGTTAVGGLVGNSYSNISNAYATGNVTGAHLVGGLVGNSNGGNIINSYATGNVQGGTAGGLVGRHGRNYGLLRNVYATGSVTGSGSSIGGLVGENAFNGRIFDAYSTDSANPLIGLNTSDGNITNTYTTGRGVIGYDDFGAMVSNSYWNTTTSGLASSSHGGTGITTAQMMSAGTFAGWSIATGGGSSAVWRIYEGQTGPLLRNFLTGITLADTSVTYSGATQAGTAVPTAGALTGTAASGRNAGTYAAFSNQRGYDISGGNLTIAKAALTVSANNDSKLADGAAYSGGNGVAYSGLVGGETSAVLGGSLLYGGSSQGASTAGNYVITANGLSSANYALTYVNGVLSLQSPAPVSQPVLPANPAGTLPTAGLGRSDLPAAYGGALQAVADLGRATALGAGSDFDASALAAAAAEAGNSGEE